MYDPKTRLSPPSATDLGLLGDRVRTFREMLGLTQAELAEVAGIAVRTIRNVEAGRSIRRSTITKICEGLDVPPASLEESVDAAVGSTYPLLYRSSKAEWHAWIDSRKAVPQDNRQRLQDPGERRRLGKLGLVTLFFNNPYLIMPDGPGTIFIEVFGHYEGAINEIYYRDCKIYCQRGTVRCQILESIVELGPGDVAGFRSADLRWLEPAHELRDSELPPLLLWIGAVPVSKSRGNSQRSSRP